MRIECPGCDAAYEVPEAQIRPGRSVRCVRCAVQWRPGGELAEAVMAPSPVELLPDSLSVPDDAAVPDEHGRDGVVRLRRSGVPVPLATVDGPVAPGANALVRKMATWRMGWMASLILLGGLLASATYWRMAIMQDWPPSIRLYTTLGAAPPQT